MRSIVRWYWCLISHHFNVSCQQTDLGSHSDWVGTIILDVSIMLVFEFPIDGYCFSRDWVYCESLSFIVVVTCWSNDNLFASLPIDSVSYCQLILIRIDCHLKFSPCWSSFLPIHRKLTVHATDSFVTEHWLLKTIVISIHDESQFILIRNFLSTCYKLTANQSY